MRLLCPYLKHNFMTMSMKMPEDVSFALFIYKYSMHILNVRQNEIFTYCKCKLDMCP